jgi:hypothetical protein
MDLDIMKIEVQSRFNSTQVTFVAFGLVRSRAGHELEYQSF